jgi:hypothetical protein
MLGRALAEIAYRGNPLVIAPFPNLVRGEGDQPGSPLHQRLHYLRGCITLMAARVIVW